MGGRRDLEWVNLEGLGEGHLVPKGEGQKHELLLYDKRHPERDDEGRPLFAVRAEDSVPVCGSPKTNGHYCEQTARYPNGRCHSHGGPSRKGVAHPNYDHGRNSKYQMPAKVIERYERFITDPELTHHRSAIAQIEALIDELWENYEEGAGPELWRELQKVWVRCKTANNTNDRVTAKRHFEELGYIIENGVRHSSQSERILRHLAERRKQADSETRRKLSESMVYTVEEAHTFYIALGAAVRKHVKDPETMNAILNDIYAIAGDAGARAPGDSQPSL